MTGNVSASKTKDPEPSSGWRTRKKMSCWTIETSCWIYFSI